MEFLWITLLYPILLILESIIVENQTKTPGLDSTKESTQNTHVRVWAVHSI